MPKTLKKNRIHFSFIILFFWFVLTKNIYSFFLFCAVVLTHEFGHYLMAKKLGYKLNNFFIAPYGVCLNYKEKSFEQKDEVLIALAGPCVNIILSVVCVSLWWVFPNIYNFTYDFVYQSLMLGFFNLLPCYPLDGGRVFVGSVSNFLPRKKAVKFATIFNIAISIILFVFFIVSCFINFNPSLCLCSVFMLFGVFEGKQECKYQPISLFNKKIKNFSKPLFLTVDGGISLGKIIKRIEINRFTIFIVALENGKTKLLDEQAVKVLSLAYPFDITLNQVFKQDKG